jgi:DNA repair exonuclease SbcCD ATPase subunit
MTDPLVLTVLVATFALATLVFVTFLVAVRADHQATIRGPMAELDELERRIATKKETLADFDADLEKRREALRDFANVQADADAVRRQLDELQIEWSQEEERRREVLALRQETEEAHDRLADATRDLTEKTSELTRVEGELVEARRLVSEIDRMIRQHAELEEQLASAGDPPALPGRQS